MKLTRSSAYALTAMACLARRGTTGLVPSHSLAAEATQIPERFLLKLLLPLVSAGILRSVRGPGGGDRLARPATEISMLDVIQAVDGPIRGEVPDVGKGAAAGFDRRSSGRCSRDRVARRALSWFAGAGRPRVSSGWG